MTSWIQEASLLSRNIKDNGESPQEVAKLLKIVQCSCNTQDDYKFLTTSEILEQIFKWYRDAGVFQELGFSVLSALIGKTVALRNDNEHVGLNFLLRIIPRLDKGDELLKKCRRAFIRTNPTSLAGGLGNLQFLEFFNDIINEVHEGLSSFLDHNNPRWPDLAAMTSYIGFLEKNSNEFIKDRSVLLKCESLVSLVDNMLTIYFSKQRVSKCIDLLRQLARLERFFFKGVEQVEDMVEKKSHEIIGFIVKSVENENLSEVDRKWMKEYNLLHPLFSSLTGKLGSEYRQFNEDKCTYSSLVAHDRTFQSATCVSKEIDGGEIVLENLLKDYKDEHSVMHQMVIIVVNLKFCPDDSLLCLDCLISKSDPELKQKFVLSIVPKIREGIPFEISINRDKIFDDSMKCINNASCHDLSGSLFVKFEKEEGIGKGVTKEWLYLVTQRMLHPTYNLFKRDTDDKRKLLPALEPVDDLQFYNFFGRIMAIALMNRVQMGATLDPILILMLAEQEVTLDDIRKSDSFLYRNLKMDVDSHLGSVLRDQLVLEDKDRKEEADIIKEYSEDLLNETIIENISAKVAEIIKGFDCVFGNPLRRKIFFQTIEPSHLDMVLYGDQQDISVADWEQYTKYNRNDSHLRSFWKVVKDFSSEERRDLLFFWTSTRFLPPGGFSNLSDPLFIEKTNISPYPSASTCDNILRIPPASYEELKLLLQEAIQQPATFGFE